MTRIETKPVSELSSTLVGVSGEYFVAAELARRGFIATITLRNSKGIDILAANSDASKTVGIQVKTNTSNKKDWMLNEKAEHHHSPILFYVFVNLKDAGEQPEYYVVPSKTVADFVRRSHKKWLSIPGKRGKPHRDNPMRHFKDPESRYRDKWELLGLE